MAQQATIIGGGIVGLSSAFYLHQKGWQVSVIDKGDMRNSCSYGNAGYICPSHFIPLATPGNVKAGIKWMWNPESPFYVQPRLNLALIQWGLQFMRSASAAHIEKSAIPLRDIALLSMKCYEEMRQTPGFDFYYEHKGLLELFQSEEKAHHAAELVEKARQLDLDAALLSREEVQALEPQTEVNALGAVLFKCDAHCKPNALMQNLLNYLQTQGIQLITREEVIGFSTHAKKVLKVQTQQNQYDTDLVVLAAGSWSRELATKLQIKIPLMPGRGYSVMSADPRHRLNYPAVLMEGRVALTPMNGATRFGGTMEVTATKTPPRLNRVRGILNAVKKYYPAFDIPLPPMEEIWYGYRPCSADGLPYLGRSRQFQNLILATGHSMIGLSLGAGTGKLVSEIANNTPLSMDIKAFEPERFGKL